MITKRGARTKIGKILKKRRGRVCGGRGGRGGWLEQKGEGLGGGGGRGGGGRGGERAGRKHGGFFVLKFFGYL